MPNTLNAWAEQIDIWATEKGFRIPHSIDEVELTLSKLMLVTTEVAEAAEAVRKGDANNFADELADIIIRVLHLSAGLDIDIEERVEQVMARNQKRPYLHGKRA